MDYSSFNLKRIKEKYSVNSGAVLDTDAKIGLIGECDFLLSRGVQTIDIKAPIFCLTEAIEQDIIAGEGQCAAQMVGARLYNEAEGTEILPSTAA